MDREQLKGKRVIVKLTGENHGNAIPVTVESLDVNGLWTRSKSLAEELIENQPILAQELVYSREPLLFLPLTQIEWLLVTDRADQEGNQE